MKIKYKLFKRSFPLICTKCGELSNMKREYCESCGEKDSLRETTKEDHAKFQQE
jgi:rRNA maturation endonuclease Nob1